MYISDQINDWYALRVPLTATTRAAYNYVLTAINRAEYAPGSRLPSERILANEIGISRVTLRKALGELSDDGLITNSPQRGWFVPRGTVGEPSSVLQSFSEMAWSRGLRPTSAIISQQERPATLEEAQRLRVAPASTVFEVIRARGMDNTPICRDTSILPIAIAAPLVEMDLTDRSLYQTLEEICGVKIHYSSYSVQAKAAPKDLADLLGIRTSSPVLVGSELAFAHDGNPVIFGAAEYRGDAYVFHAELYRSN
jgi:GntR family transcriptional regulator